MRERPPPAAHRISQADKEELIDVPQRSIRILNLGRGDGSCSRVCRHRR